MKLLENKGFYMIINYDKLHCLNMFLMDIGNIHTTDKFIFWRGAYIPKNKHAYLI